VSCVDGHLGVRCYYIKKRTGVYLTKISFNLPVNSAASSEVSRRYLTGASYTVLGGSAEAYVGWEYVSRIEILQDRRNDD